jgi:hypothetical protein
MQKCGQLEREWLVTPCVARISLIDGCYSASQSLGNYSFHGFSEELSDLHNFFLADNTGLQTFVDAKILANGFAGYHANIQLLRYLQSHIGSNKKKQKR